MSSMLRFTLLAVLLVAVMITWYANIAHLYNPTIRTPLPPPPTTYTPTSAERTVRIYALDD